MKSAKGERLNIRFNRKILLEFHGARLTSGGNTPSSSHFGCGQFRRSGIWRAGRLCIDRLYIK